MPRWSRSLDDFPERMPLDLMPISNGEYVPLPPTREERMIHALQEEEGERIRRKLGMKRRDFVRSAAALAVGLWAADKVLLGSGPAHADHTDGNGCVLENPNAQLDNLDGEFIFDIQTHHVDEDGLWKVANPGFHAFFALAWPQSGCGDLDRMECLGRYHYAKEVYMDSSTTMGVLSAVPSSPERNPLPYQTAAETVSWLNGIAGSERAVLHRFVMPNRGHGWAAEPAGQNPLFLQQELDDMTAAAQNPSLRAWKCYTPWGDVPNASGWWHDGPAGRAMIEHAIAIGVPLIATHKGFALPSFDSTKSACRDIGVVSRDYDGQCSFIVYHSGYNSGLASAETIGLYPGDGVANSSALGVDGFVKALRENGRSARHFAPGGDPTKPGTAGDGDPTKHGNCPNVYAEIGSTWRSVMDKPTQAAHLIGKLIYYVGPKRVVWGTDSLWYGSPQPVIAMFRQFAGPTQQSVRDILAQHYHLPFGLEGDIDDPSVEATDKKRTIRNGILGRNAAVPYGVNPDVAQGFITCDALDAASNEPELVAHRGTERETRRFASGVVYGPRTRRELFANMWPNKPWAP